MMRCGMFSCRDGSFALFWHSERSALEVKRVLTLRKKGLGLQWVFRSFKAAMGSHNDALPMTLVSTAAHPQLTYLEVAYLGKTC